MDSGGPSVSRSLCQRCNRPEYTKGEFTTCEGGCVKWVRSRTRTDMGWPFFVHLQLGSPPPAVEGENPNKGSILLSDDESDKDCEVNEKKILEDSDYPTNDDIGEDMSCERKRRMVEPCGGDKRRKISPGTCEEIADNSKVESDSDKDNDDKKSEHDNLSCPQSNEEGKKYSNQGLVVEGENHKEGRTYLLRPRSLSKSKMSSLTCLSDEEKFDDEEFDDQESKSWSKENVSIQKTQKKRKFVVNSIRNTDDTSPEKKEQVPVKDALPLVFKFEDDEPKPLEKEEWEKEIDNLFVELEMCISELHIGFTNPSVSPKQSEKVSDCQMGNHQLNVDEQIGLICSVCSRVILEIKYIFPNFANRPRRRYGRKYLRESPSLSDVDGFRVSDSSVDLHSPILGGETVWDLVSPSVKETMYPHQRGGFEFMWNNIAGDITLERLREPLSDSKGGCIISHPPGTGKTRLTIIFLQSFLKLFPQCRPVIITPFSLLPTWEAEFKKWGMEIPFHNLNNKDFATQEDKAFVTVFRCVSGAGRKSPHLIRLLKLKSWAENKSVLGISYGLFRILTRDGGDGYAKDTREILLKSPGLLVLEEGHTVRNNKSLVWKALEKVETEKRILLSGTLFQNNIKEFCNTLSAVKPKFAADLEQKWGSLSSYIEKNARALEELRDIISPLVHTCSEKEKKVTLLGLKNTVIHLKSTDLQKELFKRIPKKLDSFSKQNLVSLISIHPALVAKRKEFHEFKGQFCRLDPDIGVKMKFVVELIRLCDRLKERVLIFSQLLNPLNLIKDQLNYLFGWTLGQEILYMDGKLDVKQRHISINSLNDPKSDVKVLLASIKACSEGISLIGASRLVLLDILWNPSVEKQAISRAYKNGQTKFVHVYCLVSSKWEVDKIEKQTRKKYHSDVLLSRNELNTLGSVSEDNILESMVKHENLHHIFEKLSHAPSS